MEVCVSIRATADESWSFVSTSQRRVWTFSVVWNVEVKPSEFSSNQAFKHIEKDDSWQNRTKRDVRPDLCFLEGQKSAINVRRESFHLCLGFCVIGQWKGDFEESPSKCNIKAQGWWVVDTGSPGGQEVVLEWIWGCLWCYTSTSDRGSQRRDREQTRGDFKMPDQRVCSNHKAADGWRRD